VRSPAVQRAGWSAPAARVPAGAVLQPAPDHGVESATSTQPALTSPWGLRPWGVERLQERLEVAVAVMAPGSPARPALRMTERSGGHPRPDRGPAPRLDHHRDRQPGGPCNRDRRHHPCPGTQTRWQCGRATPPRYRRPTRPWKRTGLTTATRPQAASAGRVGSASHLRDDPTAAFGGTCE
jgi:hypothetical protein